MDWRGVLPAITTPFTADGQIDHAALRQHVAWLIEEGMDGVVALGSLGEGAALSPTEKRDVLASCVEAAADKAPIVAGIGATSTRAAVALSETAAEIGCSGLMVLPPYLHQGPWHERKQHLAAVLRATALPSMLYNNPSAYGGDLLPAHVAELAGECSGVAAVKESSGDARRVTALHHEVGSQVAVLAGLDDVVVEAVRAGAVGWVAGLANALPRESARLFRLAAAAGAGADELYAWFLPLLRMDTVPAFVQLIKLVQQEVGRGSERVRRPRLPLEGAERNRALTTIRAVLSRRPGAG